MIHHKDHVPDAPGVDNDWKYRKHLPGRPGGRAEGVAALPWVPSEFKMPPRDPDELDDPRGSGFPPSRRDP
jgi:hypothetical protein